MIKTDQKEISKEIQQELLFYKKLPKLFKSKGYKVDIKDDLSFSVQSENDLPPLKNNKEYKLFISNLIHGNETGGLGATNLFAKSLLEKGTKIPHSILFCLGNEKATLQGVRFTEKDLNRSFLSSSQNTHEEKQALRIGNLAKKCLFSVDLHQTNQPSETPFMIFFYSPDKMKLARFLNHKIPIIASNHERHKDGSTLDYFCYKNDTMNITLELGFAGLFKEQIEFGASFLNKALKADIKDLSRDTPFHEVYKVQETTYWDKEQIVLNRGYKNFSKIKKGELLGYCGSEEHHSKYDGIMLFPKYDEIAKNTKEVYTLAKPIQNPESL